ncbi:MAG: DUF3083 family protein [Thalassotalea sp.]
MSIIRKRSASHNANIPTNARENQYIIAEFALTDELIARYDVSNDNAKVASTTAQEYNACYRQLAETFFKLCDNAEIKNCQFIANDKLPRVRFSQEMHQWQTNQQILFYYHPSEHELSKTFYDSDIRAKKISLLFLASGLDIRLNAALMHHKVVKVLAKLATVLKLDNSCFRVKDHQHITYDIFSSEKGCEHNKTHKLRAIPTRYQQQNYPLPTAAVEMNYAVVKIPVTAHLLSLVEVDHHSADPYNPLYTFITEAYSQAAKRYNINNGAMIANGLVPIVRYSAFETTSTRGELQMLGYNPTDNPCGLISKWNAKELVDSIQLIFVANQENQTEFGYGKFLNQVEQALKLVVTELELTPRHDDVTMRFHQHIAYQLK